jgi:large subunit ribosomal protein L9
MKIILIKDVPKVGKKYEEKDVAQGFALNSLIPRGLAVPATPENSKRMKLEQQRIAGEKKVHDDLALKNFAALCDKEITLTLPANEKGHLFAGIHISEIIPEFKKQLNVDIAAEAFGSIKPLKEVGTHKLAFTVLGKKGSCGVVIHSLK